MASGDIKSTVWSTKFTDSLLTAHYSGSSGELWLRQLTQRPEWQVLPFSTTCSPCCAIYALQHHALENPKSNHEVLDSVLRAFYVDYCLQSFDTSATAKALLDKLRATLCKGGFEICQWASNDSRVVEHLPTEARSVSTDLWLSHAGVDPQESTLGLCWSCLPDSLRYKHWVTPIKIPTLRLIYRTLASQ